MSILKPMSLNEGDTIGLVSPSSCLAGLVPHRTERAISALRHLGFQVRLGEHALVTQGGLAGTAEERASDINNFFSDSSVKGIVCLIGGLHYNQLLPHLDYNLIGQHPKVFMGYSDATVVQLALFAKLGLVTFYGPAGLTQFGEHPQPQSYTVENLRKAVMSSRAVGPVVPSPMWTDEVLDWFKKEDLTRPREMRENSGFQWLRAGKAEGPLLGGCLPSMMHLRGTEYWPSFAGALLLLETPEGHDFRRGYELARVDMDLADLELSGVFDQISGLILGRGFGYREEEHRALWELVAARTSRYGFPILANVDFGHSDPIITIPLGVTGRIDSSASEFSILDSGTV
ncbi:MAG: LD-carboxypeptidase [Deltaproteobacteria bacterium]|nr:LD-carboxypeptidase [Deltaproteobacteria bacterium]